MNNKHLINFISVWVVSALNLFLPIIIMIFLGRSYKTGEFGDYSVATSFTSTLAVFLSFGLGNVLSFEVAAVENTDKTKISDLIISSLASLAIYSILSFCFAAIALFLLNYNSEIVFLIVLLGIGYWFIGANSVLSGVFMGLKKMHIPAVAATFSVVAAIILIVPSLYFHQPIWKIALFWSISQAFGCLVTFGFVCRDYGFTMSKINKKLTYIILKRSTGVGFDSVISRLGSNLTNILLPLYLTSYQIGIFNGAFKPYVFLAFSGECCMRFFSPYLAGIRYDQKSNIEFYLSVMHKIVAFFSLTMFIAPLFFSTSFIKLIFGDRLLESSQYMSVLALGYLIYYLPPQTPPLIALGMEWKVIWCSIIRLLINLICLVVFVPLYGIMGAVIAINLSFFGYWVTTVLLYKKAGLKPVRSTINFFIFGCVTCTIGFTINFLAPDKYFGIIAFFIMSCFASLMVYWEDSEKKMVLSHLRSFIRC